ncbi:MAG: hypothetical protein GY715_21385, partial [Planctomycetes bacterium]|nr:hypothetical protein [Planctomycetota bacterium]
VGDNFVAGPHDLAADAERTFTLEATSPGGQATQLSHRVTRDVTGPALAFTAPAADAVVDTSSIDVTGTASDLHLDRVTVNGRTASLGAGTFQVESLALAEGENVLRARAEDLAGNATEVERTVVLDTRAPELAITDPARGTVTGEAPYTFSGTVADPHLDRVEVAGQAATLTGDRWSISVALAEGDNEIVVEAFDTLGHRGTASVDVEFQSDAPSVHIDEPAEGFVTSSSPIDVSGTVDAEATVTVNGEAAVVTDGTFTATDLALFEGQNRLLARATD